MNQFLYSYRKNYNEKNHLFGILYINEYIKDFIYNFENV